MWLHVPNTSISSPSAPAEEGLISASNWQFQALERCAWSRGKPSRSRNWYQLWKRASWLQRLYGAMPEPSTADAGVEAWTASLAASRASLIALPERREVRTTNVTFGPTRAASSSSRAPGSPSSKMSAACSRRGMTKSLALNEYSETFQSLVSRLREDCSRREKLARLTVANAYSSLPWPTTSASFNAGDEPERFKERAARLKAKHNSGNGAGMTLATAANVFQGSAWPTPAARDYKGANSSEHLDVASGRKHLDQLPNFVAHLWQTPAVADTTGGRMTRSGSRSNEMLLKGQAADLSRQWMTPRSHEVGQYQYSRGDKTKPVATLTGQAFSRPDQPTKMLGAESSNDRRALNPRFVEWLMGWPPMWTNSACSATALSHFKQHMRSALSQLGFPPAAPPAQLALFG